ncbi:hypothetical protein FKM82_026445 [Ascaphus truei]
MAYSENFCPRLYTLELGSAPLHKSTAHATAISACSRGQLDSVVGQAINSMHEAGDSGKVNKEAALEYKLINRLPGLSLSATSSFLPQYKLIVLAPLVLTVTYVFSNGIICTTGSLLLVKSVRLKAMRGSCG